MERPGTSLRKPCIKCLLEDMDKDAYLENLCEYIRSYPKEKRVAEDVYQKRLSVCRSCGELSEGICAKCGCFVELRALKINAYCPDECDKWK